MPAAMAVQMMASRIPADASSLIRSMFHRPSDKPQPGMGVFPPDWMSSTFMPTAVRAHDQYSRPAGAVARSTASRPAT